MQCCLFCHKPEGDHYVSVVDYRGNTLASGVLGIICDSCFEKGKKQSH